MSENTSADGGLPAQRARSHHWLSSHTDSAAGQPIEKSPAHRSAAHIARQRFSDEVSDHTNDLRLARQSAPDSGLLAHRSLLDKAARQAAGEDSLFGRSRHLLPGAHRFSSPEEIAEAVRAPKLPGDRLTRARSDQSPDGNRPVLERAAFTPVNGSVVADRTVTDGTQRDLSRYPVENIKVDYQNLSRKKADDPEPNFVIRRDGQLQMPHNPDLSTDKQIVIQLERRPGDIGDPPQKQREALDQLVKLLSERFMPQNNIGARTAEIADQEGLMSPEARRAMVGAVVPPVEQVPAPAQHQIENIHRWRGASGQGERVFTNQEAGEQFAPRDTARQRGENDAIAAMKDVVSGFATRGEADPYHSVKNWGQGEHHVGRYGVTASQYKSWLQHAVAGLTPEQIDKLVKEGKLPPGAVDLANILQGKDATTEDGKQLAAFLNKIQTGNDADKPSAFDVDKFFGKNLQEKVGTDLVKKYAFETADKDAQGRPTAVDVGKTALSFLLGHSVSQEEMDQPQFKEYRDAAIKAYTLAVQKEQGYEQIDLNNNGGRVASIARAFQGRALWTQDLGSGNLGCASSVSTVLRAAGVNVRELGVDGLSDHLQKLGWRRDSFEHRRPGDVIIVPSVGGHGHTGIVGENVNQTYDNHSGSGRWSPDDPSFWYRRGGRQGLYVLHAPGAA